MIEMLDPIAPEADTFPGAMMTPRGAMPLAALSVSARIDGLVAATSVRQSFTNAFDEPLEATYLFPLPDRAAVTRCRFEAGGRVIEADLQEKNQARETYQRAVKAGHRAALAEEETPGVFRLRVGNLMPGETAAVSLDLVGPVPLTD
ncbi:MAG: VIT domain-containing protein, partial [Gemmataceae bacterium]